MTLDESRHSDADAAGVHPAHVPMAISSKGTCAAAACKPHCGENRTTMHRTNAQNQGPGTVRSSGINFNHLLT